MRFLSKENLTSIYLYKNLFENSIKCPWQGALVCSGILITGCGLPFKIRKSFFYRASNIKIFSFILLRRRVIVGTFMAFDRHMNIVLGDAEEFRKIKAKKGTGVSEEKEEKRALGLIILRGDSVVSLTIEGLYSFLLSFIYLNIAKLILLAN